MRRDRIEKTVSKNRSANRRLGASVVEFGPSDGRKTNADGVTITAAAAEARVYDRSAGASLLVGHPDAARGAGRGEAGDKREASWTLRETITSDILFVRDGRRAVARAIRGDGGGYEVAVGSGTAAPSESDGSLGSRDASAGVYAGSGSSGTSTSAARFRIGSFGPSFEEAALFGAGGAMMVRLLSGGWSQDPDRETRVEVDCELEGSGTRSAAFADAAAGPLAESVARVGGSNGVLDMGVGTGDTGPSPTDSSLDNEVGNKRAARQVSASSVEAVVRFEANEPSGQPYDLKEAAAYDPSGTMWVRSLIGNETKTDETGLEISIPFDIKS